ncbi:MAG: hypothetical protein ACKVOX_05160 [Rhizobacter sp.]
MLSSKKRLLRISELLALAGSAVMLWQAVRTFLSPPSDFPAFLAASLCLAGLLFSLLPVCMLGAEYIRTVRRATTPEERSDGLSSSEIAFLTRWSPRAYKVGAWLALSILLGTLVYFGGVTITTHEELEPAKVPAVFLYFSVFYLMCLPVLGSATRMPATYAANSDASQETP